MFVLSSGTDLIKKMLLLFGRYIVPECYRILFLLVNILSYFIPVSSRSSCFLLLLIKITIFGPSEKSVVLIQFLLP